MPVQSAAVTHWLSSSQSPRPGTTASELGLRKTASLNIVRRWSPVTHVPAPAGQSASAVQAIGDVGVSVWQWPWSGGPELALPGFTTRGVSSRRIPDTTGIPAGTSAVSSPDETNVVGSVSMSAFVVASRSSSWAPARKLTPKICTPNDVALFRTLGPTEYRTGTPDAAQTQEDRHAPGHAASAGGSHCSGASMMPSPHTWNLVGRPTVAPGWTATDAAAEWPPKPEGSMVDDWSVKFPSGWMTESAPTPPPPPP